MIKIDNEKVLLLHQLLIEKTGGEPNIRDMKMLDSSINQAYQTFDGAELYKTKEEKAARLGFSLVSNHAFVDGTFWFNLREYSFFLMTGILCSTPVFRIINDRLNLMNPKIVILTNSLYYAFQLGLFIISFSFLVMRAHNPFIYFQYL